MRENLDKRYFECDRLVHIALDRYTESEDSLESKEAVRQARNVLNQFKREADGRLVDYQEGIRLLEVNLQGAEEEIRANVESKKIKTAIKEAGDLD